MHNFVFHNPTKVLFGTGQLESFGQETVALGSKVLLLSGVKSAEQSGLLPQLRSQLRQAGVDFVELQGISANPTLERVQHGVRLAKETKRDLICGVGGGSVIDSAKAISAGAMVEHNVWKFFTGKKSIRHTLPVIAVPTIAGSGSEVNSGMVLTNSETQQKFGFGHRLLHPKVAFLDPQLTFSVPADLTAFGAVDSLAHVLEFYLTHQQPDPVVQLQYMEGLSCAIVSSCEKALADPGDYQARGSLMWAAALALNGLSASGLGKVGFPMHLIEHALSGANNTPHGAGLGVVIPGWLRYRSAEIGDRIQRILARALELSTFPIAPDKDQITAFTQWLRFIGTPTTLEEMSIDSRDIPNLAANSQALARIWRMREYTTEVIEQILTLCLKKNSPH